MAKTTAGKRPKKLQTRQTLQQLRTNMRRLQHDAESVLGRTQKRAAQLLSRDQKRAIDRLLAQARRLRADLEKRARRVTREVEARTERFVATVEKEATKRLKELLKRLDLPSRHELDELSRRIGQIEKRTRGRRATAPAATPKTVAKAHPPASRGR